MKLNRIYITLQINFTQLFTGKGKKKHFISNLYLNNGHRKALGFRTGCLQKARIAREFNAACAVGSGGQGPRGTSMPSGEQVPDVLLMLDPIGCCCVALCNCLAFSGPLFPSLHKENTERWFMPGYSRRTWEMVEFVLSS